MVFTTDADGEGDVDVFSASLFDDKITVYLKDGSNNYTENLISTNANDARSVFVADADEDGDVDVFNASVSGDVDIFSASVSDDKIVVYEIVNADNDVPNITSGNTVSGEKNKFFPSWSLLSLKGRGNY